MDFEPYFKVHSLVSVHPKSIILGQTTNLNMIFHVGVSVYRFVRLCPSTSVGLFALNPGQDLPEVIGL